MNLVYERSGGFVGMMQRLRIEDFQTLRVRDKRGVQAERPMTPEEADQLKALLDGVAQAPPPEEPADARRASDSYNVILSFDNEPEPRVSLSTLSLPILGAGDAWDELLGWLDRRLSAELRSARPPAP
jgi:hypothetical protein